MRRPAGVLVAATVCAVAVLGATAAAPAGLGLLPRAGAATPAPVRLTQVGRSQVASLTSSQGLATVTSPDGSRRLQYRGLTSIPLDVALEGWTHVGDPDAHDGYLVDAYEGSSDAPDKMFRVTAPDGSSSEYVHTLVPGEEYNNSFAAISPDGQWLVAGEWDTMTHLQVYPAPRLNPATPPGGGTLDLAGYITLDRPVNDIQGCDFLTATRLVCASDDTTGQLWPDVQPLLQVDLAHPLDGTSVAGQVSDIMPVPHNSICSGTFEAEGVDYDPASGILRAEVVEPGICVLVTDVYQFRVG